MTTETFLPGDNVIFSSALLDLQSSRSEKGHHEATVIRETTPPGKQLAIHPMYRSYDICLFPDRYESMVVRALGYQLIGVGYNRGQDHLNDLALLPSAWSEEAKTFNQTRGLVIAGKKRPDLLSLHTQQRMLKPLTKGSE